MRIWTVAASAALVGALVVCGVTPAAAQGQSTDLSGGYQYVRDIDEGLNLTKGWVASLNRHLDPVVTLVAEVNGTYNNGGKQHVFQGGVRFGNSSNPDVTPFGQVLAGFSRLSGAGASANGFNLQPGGGIDLRATDTAFLRLQGDYVMTRSSGVWSKSFRLAASVVFSLNQ